MRMTLQHIARDGSLDTCCLTADLCDPPDLTIVELHRIARHRLAALTS